MQSICNLCTKYGVPKKIPLVFHNGSNYDYFAMKDLAGEFQIKCISDQDQKNCETCRIKCKHCDCLQKYTNIN